MTKRYFYTTETPNKFQYRSGPLIEYYDPYTTHFELIPTLERAKELAEDFRHGNPEEKDYVKTTYGVMEEYEV